MKRRYQQDTRRGSSKKFRGQSSRSGRYTEEETATPPPRRKTTPFKKEKVKQETLVLTPIPNKKKDVGRTDLKKKNSTPKRDGTTPKRIIQKKEGKKKAVSVPAVADLLQEVKLLRNLWEKGKKTPKKPRERKPKEGEADAEKVVEVQIEANEESAAKPDEAVEAEAGSTEKAVAVEAEECVKEEVDDDKGDKADEEETAATA